MPEDKPPLKPPSEEFTRAFRGGYGSTVMECDFCKRLYFGDEDGYDAGERERYEELAKTEPDKYIAVAGSSSAVEVGGKTWVDGCACNAPRRYEDWIWHNRSQIAEYLQKRNGAILGDAASLKIMLDAAVTAHDAITRRDEAVANTTSG